MPRVFKTSWAQLDGRPRSNKAAYAYSFNFIISVINFKVDWRVIVPWKNRCRSLSLRERESVTTFFVEMWKFESPLLRPVCSWMKLTWLLTHSLRKAVSYDDVIRTQHQKINLKFFHYFLLHVATRVFFVTFSFFTTSALLSRVLSTEYHWFPE